MTESRIKTYDEFWLFYLREHSDARTRYLHYLGTFLGIFVLFIALYTATWWLIPVALVPGYGFAWIGHFVVEKNTPATFQYPLWSFMSDWKMMGMWLVGRLDKELQRAGVDHE